MIDPGSPTIMSRSSVMSSPDTSSPDHKRQNQTLYLLRQNQTLYLVAKSDTLSFGKIRHFISWQNQTLYLLPRQPQLGRQDGSSRDADE
jgi:hypothetical protein